MRDREPPLDWSRPILEQRHYWFHNWAYSKPILATEPCDWFPGFHARRDGEYNPDDRLYLLHLHRMDFDYCLRRHQTRKRMRWNEEDFDTGMASHNRIVSEAELEEWFYTETEIPNVPVKIEKMPEKWQRVVLRTGGPPTFDEP
jgi:hypothetical protein